MVKALCDTGKHKVHTHQTATRDILLIFGHKGRDLLVKAQKLSFPLILLLVILPKGDLQKFQFLFSIAGYKKQKTSFLDPKYLKALL